MKRILHILDRFDCYGPAWQLGLLVSRLPREAFQHEVYFLDAAASKARPPDCIGGVLGSGKDFAEITLGRRWPLDPQTWWRLRRATATAQPDLIHAWGPAATGYGFSVAKSCGLRRFVARQDDCPASNAGGRLAQRWIGHRADAIVVPSAAARDACIARGLPAARIRVIQSGVALPASCTAGQPWRGQLGLDPSCRLVGWLGPLDQRQRVKDAIWATDLLKVIRDDVHLLIFGAGPDRDRLLRFRDQVLIRDKVHFLAPPRDVFAAMAELDVFWSTGGGGNPAGPILAAMAAGIPVVATDLPAARELVGPGVTGYLVPVGHRAGLSRWTQQLLESSELAHRLGAAGQSRVLADFPLEKMVQGYAALYHELLP